MTAPTGGSTPIEVHLPDGGHVIVAFADAAARGNSNVVVEALLDAWGSEVDVGRAIARDVADAGLDCSISDDRHPTILTIAGR